MCKSTIKYKSQNIYIELKKLGDDLLLAIWGGDSPHIGAVSIGIPRASLDDSSRLSSTISSYSFIGHKDDILGNKCADLFAKSLDKNIVVTTGIHYDKISREDIKYIVDEIMNRCQEIINNLD